jgi:hypothetical protein
MKLPGMLLKAGLASAGAGIYLYFKKLFKRKKKTKKQPAKNLKQTKAVKKTFAKPRQKRSPAIAN